MEGSHQTSERDNGKEKEDHKDGETGASVCVGCRMTITKSSGILCDECSGCMNEDYDLVVSKSSAFDELSEGEDEEDWLFDDDIYSCNSLNPAPHPDNSNNLNNTNQSNHQNNSINNNNNSQNNINNINNSTITKPSFQSSITSFFSNFSKKSQTSLDSWLGTKPLPPSPPPPPPPKKPLAGSKRNSNTPKLSPNQKSNTRGGGSGRGRGRGRGRGKVDAGEQDEEEGGKRQKTEEPVQRKPPFYKRVENSNFFVDPFRYDCRIGCAEPKYFLSHFHADHYGGITNKWDRGPIICSEVTASLLRTRLRVHPKFVQPLPLNSPVVLDNTKITLLDANHCPGACMFLFEFPNGQRALHVGDCRYCTEMRDYKELQNKQIDLLYLDTTYCNPAYTFPTQTTVINRVAEIVANHLKPNTLFIVGTYTIGKERIIVQLVKVFGFKVYAQPWKAAILKQLKLPAQFISSLTTNPDEAQLHIAPIWQLSLEKLTQNSNQKYTNVIAFKPTGWTHKSGGLSTCSKRGNVSIYGVPYSEHSSFTELREFVDYLKPRKIIPTVNNSNAARVKEMVALLTSK